MNKDVVQVYNVLCGKQIIFIIEFRSSVKFIVCDGLLYHFHRCNKCPTIVFFSAPAK